MVQFGLRQNMLNETSITVDGNKNVMNEAHTVVIDDFHSGTNFTTCTLTRNGYGSEQSSLGTFMTLPNNKRISIVIVDGKHHYTCSGKYSSLI